MSSRVPSHASRPATSILKGEHSSGVSWQMLASAGGLLALVLVYLLIKPTLHDSITIGPMWVATDRLAERSCPSSNCGVIDKLRFGEIVHVQEVKGEWARVTSFYNASCVSRRSRRIYEGNNSCTPENGIVDGTVANWVQSEGLSRSKPYDGV